MKTMVSWWTVPTKYLRQQMISPEWWPSIPPYRSFSVRRLWLPLKYLPCAATRSTHGNLQWGRKRNQFLLIYADRRQGLCIRGRFGPHESTQRRLRKFMKEEGVLWSESKGDEWSGALRNNWTPQKCAHEGSKAFATHGKSLDTQIWRYTAQQNQVAYLQNHVVSSPACYTDHDSCMYSDWCKRWSGQLLAHSRRRKKSWWVSN